MNRRKASAVIFSAVLVLLAFGLGYLFGYDAAEPEFQVTVEQPAQEEAVKEKKEVKQGPVDLNTATQEELEQLPGIGPAIAGRIVEYRRTYGSFTTIEQVMDVKGVGESKFEGMKEFLSIGGIE